MPIRTTIAPHYAWRMIIIGALCLVLGVWGVYDYVEVIPSRMMAHERGDLATAVRDAMMPGATRTQVNEALDLLEQAEASFAERFGDGHPPVSPAAAEADAEAIGRDLRETINSLRAGDQESWRRALATFRAGLNNAPVPQGQVLADEPLYAYEVADRAVQRVANIRRPSRFDRPTQWAFILCLPFVPYFFGQYILTRRRVYQLDSDGTLHLPGAVWAQDDIADIDMSRWMKKSVAYVVHQDGTRVKLDDYKHKNLHLIVGAIASRLYPDQWDEEARPKKQSQSEDETDEHEQEQHAESVE